MPPRISNLSSASQDAPSVAVLDEQTFRGRSIVLTPTQKAVYVHVDDGLTLAAGASAPTESDALMNLLADALEGVGFSVKQREPALEVERVLGYCVERAPAALTLPPGKEAAAFRRLPRACTGIGLLHGTCRVHAWTVDVVRASQARAPVDPVLHVQVRGEV